MNGASLAAVHLEHHACAQISNGWFLLRSGSLLLIRPPTALDRVPSYAGDKSGHCLAPEIERQVIGALLPDSGRRPKVGFGRGVVSSQSHTQKQ